jgi:hypothetical protein
MIQDFFCHICNIYRLGGFAHYNASESEEGEVTEEWGIIALDVPCRFEPEDTAFQRRSDGIVDTGYHTVFMGKNADIQNADRIYWAASEFGTAFYEVRAVMPKRDRFNRMHHKEIRLDHIDWTPPVITELWESS